MKTPQFTLLHSSSRRIDFPEGYHVTLRAALNQGEGRLLTLSQGGAFVATRSTLLPQARLALAIDVPELSRTVEVEAIVAWENRGPARPSTAQPDGYGLRFVRVPTASMEAIRWLLHRDEAVADDPEKTRSLAPWEVQEAMERAEARHGKAAVNVHRPRNPFAKPPSP
ncbi:MAG: PilZ domain-containing protein [Vicinamibacteria bacterium]